MRRRPFAPEPVDEHVLRDDVVRVEEHKRKELAVLLRGDLDLDRIAADFDRTQDRKAQHANF